jgi:predicted MFS family arabinose efflux permease
MGFAGLLAALIIGRFSTRGRERQIMSGAMLASALAIAVLPFASAVPVVGAVLIVVGLANGPLDIAMFTVRQRRTDPAWFGRAFAVSMAVNFVGTPIGSAFAGPLIEWSLNAALWVAVVIAVAAAVLALLLVPARDDSAASS